MRTIGGRLTLRLVVLLAGGLIAASCSSSDDGSASDVVNPTSTSPTTAASTSTSPPSEPGILSELPPEARSSTGGGDPRPPAYWQVWNACADDNRAEEAAANGGPAAGWYLVDDVLTDPGLQLGDHVVTSCEESVALLGGLTSAGQATADPAYSLAAQLLTAELNLNAGAATCPVAEEAVVGGHFVLSSANFDGVSTSPLDAEAAGALPRFVELLTMYNLGELCR